MHFLVDAQLPPLLCSWLRGKGHAAAHVTDHGLAGASDHVIWARAVADDAIVLTKDEDFVIIRRSAANGPAVCWLRIGNVTNPTLLNWFDKIFPGLSAALAAGEMIIEVR